MCKGCYTESLWLGEDASDLSIPEGNNRLEWIVRNIVIGLQTDEEDLFPTCPTETQEEEADEDDEDNESERTTNVSRGRTTDTFSAPVSASSTVIEEDLAFILKCSTFLAVISEYSTASVNFPLTSLLCSLYRP